MTDLVNACTSSSVMRPLGPWPLTSAKGTPSSRANLRTEGDAWGKEPVGATLGLCAGATETGAACAIFCWATAAIGCATEAGAGARAATGVAGLAAGAVAVGASAAGAAAALAVALSSTKTTEPCLTLSPIFTRSSLTTPACEDGISIAALSLSTVMSDCSARTVSPGLTISSMMVTSSKSPMSGTCTSTNAICVSYA